MTPNINFGHLKDLEDRAATVHNNDMSISQVPECGITRLTTTRDSTRSESTTDDGENDAAAARHRIPSAGERSSVSTATVETMISPMVETGGVRAATVPLQLDHGSTVQPSSMKADCNLVFARTNMPLPPRQGQNPTVERNTHRSSDEELAIDGNTLVNKKDYVANNMALQNGNVATDDDIFEAIAGLDHPTIVVAGRMLIQNDILDMHNQNHLSTGSTGSGGIVQPTTMQQANQLPRSANQRRQNQRISYVQNPVEALNEPATELLVQPKRQNIPRNGGTNYSVVRATSAPVNNKKSSRFGALRKQLAGKSGTNGGMFGLPLFRLAAGTKSGAAPTDAGGHDDCNVTTRPLQSEVCLMNGGSTVVRPTSLPLNGLALPAVTSDASNRHSMGPNNVQLSQSKPSVPQLEANHKSPPPRSINEPTDGLVAAANSSSSSSIATATAAVVVTDNNNLSGSEEPSSSHGSDEPSSSAHGDNYGYDTSCSPTTERQETCVV